MRKQKKQARYDQRSRALMLKATLAAILSLVFALFTGMATVATWPQFYLLHNIGWGLVALFAAAAVAACLTARRLEARAYALVLVEIGRRAAERQSKLDALAESGRPRRRPDAPAATRTAPPVAFTPAPVPVVAAAPTAAAALPAAPVPALEPATQGS